MTRLVLRFVPPARWARGAPAPAAAGEAAGTHWDIMRGHHTLCDIQRGVGLLRLFSETRARTAVRASSATASQQCAPDARARGCWTGGAASHRERISMALGLERTHPRWRLIGRRLIGRPHLWSAPHCAHCARALHCAHCAALHCAHCARALHCAAALNPGELSTASSPSVFAGCTRSRLSSAGTPSRSGKP